MVAWLSHLVALAPASAAVPPSVGGVDLSDGTTVVVFVSSRCPCSMAHEPKLRALHERFAPQGVRFIGVSSNADETDAEAREHFKAGTIGFPVIRDSGARLADAFGALKTPHAFVVRNGRILYQGGVDDSVSGAPGATPLLASALEAIQAGREPERARGRALGCVIKRP